MFLTEGCSSLSRSDKPGWVLQCLYQCPCAAVAAEQEWRQGQEQQHCCSHGLDTSKRKVRKISSKLTSTGEATPRVLGSVLGPSKQERHRGVGACSEEKHRAREGSGEQV